MTQPHQEIEPVSSPVANVMTAVVGKNMEAPSIISQSEDVNNSPLWVNTTARITGGVHS